MFHECSDFLAVVFSGAMLNSRPKSISPCSTTTTSGFKLARLFAQNLSHFGTHSIVVFTNIVSSPGKPFSSITFHSCERSILAYSVLTSMNSWCVGIWYPRQLSWSAMSTCPRRSRLDHFSRTHFVQVTDDGRWFWITFCRRHSDWWSLNSSKVDRANYPFFPLRR